MNMRSKKSTMHRVGVGLVGGWIAAALLAGCGGGTGTLASSGAEKTTLTVSAADADGDTLSYQWRVTAGSIDNRNARSTVWTLPDGPGLHFAYATVSDGRGGYFEQQYAVSSDALDVPAPVKAPIARSVSFAGQEGGTGLLTFKRTGYRFADPGGGPAAEREVYLPSVRVELRTSPGNQLAYAGETDAAGQINLPQLPLGTSLDVLCAVGRVGALRACGTTITPAAVGAVQASVLPAGDPAHNLRLFGHVGFADGGVCHYENEFSGVRSTATVQLQLADGTALTPPLDVNRFGDYAVDAAVPVNGALKLRVRCEALDTLVDVPAAAGAGYVGGAPVELSHVLANQRPRIVKMVANGPEGSVRGRMVEPELGVSSNGLPGPSQFLAFRGLDTRRGACQYYKSFGAVADCDAQGNMVDAISLEDWKRQHGFGAHASGNAEFAATYVNKMDLNLVRRMVATQTSADNIAFVVCNHPGPEGTSQREVDEVIATALADERLVACVAMEWSVTPGANGGRPFTKFLTFGPDGSLLLSINLDGRGEKYMPGTCVACHGGTQYRGRFPETGNPSPYLGAGFLPFDNGNYLFSSQSPLRKQAQQASVFGLNALVRATERDNPSSAVRNLVNGWYANDTRTDLDEAYVPPQWHALDATRPGAARLYREIVGAACRTCHVAFQGFDWDASPTRIVSVDPAVPSPAKAHLCGGSANLVVNASMPNALISRDRALQRVASDPELASLMQQFFGCTTPLPDPAYARR